MSDGDKTPILALTTGIVAGALLSGAIFSVYNTFSKKRKSSNESDIDTYANNTRNISLDNTFNTTINNNSIGSDSVKHDLINVDSNSINVNSNLINIDLPIDSTTVNCMMNNNLKQISDHLHVPVHTILHHHEDVTDIKMRMNKERLKITEIDKSPLELRKRFDNKGYVFITRNLATVNTELNELVELMRKLDLQILNGCKDPSTCCCNFRHKRCRLFMIRKYSDSPELQFFAPSCSGVTNISPSNADIKNGTPIHEYVQLFQNKFADRVMDLVNYINFIIEPERRSQFIVDITLIADPCAYTGPFAPEYNHKNNNNNSAIDLDEKTNIIAQAQTQTHINTDNNDKGKIVVDTKLIRNSRCTIKWNQARFVEARTNKTHSYDYVAMFLLGSANVTPHKLMIGKIKDDVDISKMSNEEIQENVVLLADTWIDSDNNSDIGYIIDQKQGYLHKHSDFDYMNEDAIRNVITIRLKYLN